MATLNVSLPDEMRTWIDEQVKTGKFANASDYIRDLVRRNQSEREAISLALSSIIIEFSRDLNSFNVLSKVTSLELNLYLD